MKFNVPNHHLSIVHDSYLLHCEGNQIAVNLHYSVSGSGAAGRCWSIILYIEMINQNDCTSDAFKCIIIDPVT